MATAERVTGIGRGVRPGPDPVQAERDLERRVTVAIGLIERLIHGLEDIAQPEFGEAVDASDAERAAVFAQRLHAIQDHARMLARAARHDGAAISPKA